MMGALPEKWLKASVVGTLWAAIEILLGSLLHNLRVPLAGSLLSVATVSLVVAFYQLWPVRGLIWRAGVICALMKSISPSAIILGPMAGILSEAVLLELTIRLLGAHPFAYLAGGALAVSSALVQKAATLLILYGWDLVLLLDSLVSFAFRQLGFVGPAGVYLLIALLGGYLLAGAFAGFAGYRVGKAFLANPARGGVPVVLSGKPQSELFRHTKKKTHSVSLLFLAFVLLIAGMVLINHASLMVSAVFAVAYTALAMLRYRANMRYLKKPALGIQLGLVLLFSALFFEGFSSSLPEMAAGVQVGLNMVLRAMVLLTSFSVISAELKNPVIKKILYQQGLKNLYLSLDMAFSVLPAVMKTYNIRSLRLSGFRKVLFNMLGSAETLLQELIRLERSRPPVFILSGGVHQGKTTAAREVVNILREHGLKVRGFFSTGNTNDHHREAYFIEEVNSGKRQLLCRLHPDPCTLRVGRFCFDEQGLAVGRAWLREDAAPAASLVVVDEVGPLELRGEGWAPALEDLLSRGQTPQLWVVRDRLTEKVTRKWQLGELVVFSIEEHAPSGVAARIMQSLSQSL